jgi:hypothetical protein
MRVRVAIVALGEVAVEGLVMMEFFRLGSSVCRAHWPMQGPHAFASTTPPMASKVFQQFHHALR